MFGGAWVVDRRIHVNIAKFNRISSYWRNVRPTTPLRNSSQVDKHKGVEFEEGECSKQQLKSNKRILGHVEDEGAAKVASISGESSETGDNDPGPDQQVEGSDGANVLETGELENSIPAGN
ncbi:hypothetical protein V6N12_016855 [Hibiscus sabdariffa]|uniref:Uncharacterized protein n=1 Tax=Hibiscus sabdariffa TaxID=183260 RepID=A0ABR2BPC0_9ROSI